MPQAVAQAPSFSTRTPVILNSGNVLLVAIPVLNSGNASANNLIITDITMGSVPRVQPALPLPLGTLAKGNSTAVNARFSNNGLTAGSRYLVTVRGTYEAGNVTLGFSLNRTIVVPALVAPPVPFLVAHMQVTVDEVLSTWSYTVFNDEPSGSQRFVNAISLDMAAPFTVTAPAGWAVNTDNFFYVLWYATDQQLPYPHQIAPGASLGGFQIQSPRRNSEGRAFSITSWNHQSDQADLVALGTALTPSRT